MNNLDRKRGCLYGLAIGDALGAAVEFRSPGTFALVTTYRSGGPHSLAKGQWTDDTSMALALAHSIGEKGWDLKDQMSRYLDWFQNGRYSVNGFCFDIGCTTRDALMNFERDGDPWKSGDPAPGSSGNGSIMRLAPVAIHTADLLAEGHVSPLTEKASDSSQVTHASDQCRSACRYMNLVLAGLINGESRETVLDPEWEPVQIARKSEQFDPLIENVIQGSYRNKTPNMVRGSGWVVASLEAALWAFHDADSFDEAVLRAVNLGEDADTTGAVCGQFAGAYWGLGGIPAKFVDGLDRKDMIESALKALGCPAPARELKDYIDFGPKEDDGTRVCLHENGGSYYGDTNPATYKCTRTRRRTSVRIVGASFCKTRRRGG
jgi:ADP-ribosyl-[dinitrogen reductase] hydrolase